MLDEVTPLLATELAALLPLLLLHLSAEEEEEEEEVLLLESLRWCVLLEVAFLLTCRQALHVAVSAAVEPDTEMEVVVVAR